MRKGNDEATAKQPKRQILKIITAHCSIACPLTILTMDVEDIPEKLVTHSMMQKKAAKKKTKKTNKSSNNQQQPEGLAAFNL